jgi:hypothetical protein
MNRPLITWQGVDAAHENVSRLGAAVEDSHPAKRPPSCAYKALSRSPFAEASFPSSSAHVPSATLSQSTHFLVWISDLISIASMCYKPIAHNSTDASVAKFSKFLPPTMRRCSAVPLASICLAADEWPLVSSAPSRRPVTPVRSHGRPLRDM